MNLPENVDMKKARRCLMNNVYSCVVINWWKINLLLKTLAPITISANQPPPTPPPLDIRLKIQSSASFPAQQRPMISTQRLEPSTSHDNGRQTGAEWDGRLWLYIKWTDNVNKFLSYTIYYLFFGWLGDGNEWKTEWFFNPLSILVFLFFL